MNSPPELPVEAFIAVIVVLVLIGIAIYLCQNEGGTRATRNHGYPHYDTRNYGYDQYQNQFVLESGRMPKLDLHGYRSYEARPKIYDFLQENRHSKVEIVTGRGLSSIDEPVLKPLLEGILHEKRLQYETKNLGGSYIINNW